MDRQKFAELVSETIDNLPCEFREKLDNVDITVEDLPSSLQRKKLRLGNPLQLLGLYEGVPQTKRGTGYTLVLPDKITLFQKPIEARCRNLEARIKLEIDEVIKHEIAHHFGIGESSLLSIETKKKQES